MCLIPLLDWRGVCPQIETLVLILSFESLIYFQQAYFKCEYDCFDRRRNQEGINNCVENCSVPVLTANNLVENEMAKFQVPLIFGTMSCRCFFPPKQNNIDQVCLCLVFLVVVTYFLCSFLILKF